MVQSAQLVVGFLLGLAAGVCLVGQVSRLPARLLHWRRELWRVYWRRKSRNRGGRPPIRRELIELIRRMSLENPLWGAPRLHGELLKLGLRVAQSTVSRYMVPRPDRPRRDWPAFLRNNADAIASIDLFTVQIGPLGRAYGAVVLGHGRRRILHIDATDHPTAEWLAHHITEAFPWDEAPAFLVRDNDGTYGLKFRRRVRAMGIRDKPTWPPRSPWQNGWVERLIGSIRRECLDHQMIWSIPHLRRVLREYTDYYNDDRPHLSLGKDSPNSRVVEAAGSIISRPVLGGLHHRYGRIPPD